MGILHSRLKYSNLIAPISKKERNQSSTNDREVEEQ